MINRYEEGEILLINKPVRWTSFDVVKKLRYTLGVKKVGHAGTLDPLATGLLIVGTGKFTKKLNELQGLDKTYKGIFEIGKTTPSFDLETEFDSTTDYHHLSLEKLHAAIMELSGEIAQMPPAHSAVKIRGERAYKKARKNEAIKLEPRYVRIYQFDVSCKNLPEIEFTINCSKGTYIRSIARDFGRKLDVGAYLKKLVRTSIGSYQLADAYELDEFVKKHDGSS